VLCRCRCRQPAKRVPEAFCRPLRGLTTTATLPYGRGSDNDTTTRGCRETRNPKHETRRKQQTPNDNGDAPLRSRLGQRHDDAPPRGLRPQARIFDGPYLIRRASVAATSRLTNSSVRNHSW
jgi:hypothetical protein